MPQPKPKKQNLSKKELALLQAKKEEAARFKKLIKEKIYPILLKGGKSVVHAQQTVQIIDTVIVGKMADHWVGKTLANLELAESLTKEDGVKDKEMYAELLEALSDLPIKDAKDLLKGMDGALDNYTRKLSMEAVLPEIGEIIND